MSYNKKLLSQIHTPLTKVKGGGKVKSNKFIMTPKQGQPCYECGGMYAQGGEPIYKYQGGGTSVEERSLKDKDCGIQRGINKENARMNSDAARDAIGWARQAARNEKIIAAQDASKLAGQLNFDYDWSQSPVDKAEKKAAVAQYKQFFQQNPNVFVADDTSGYSPEQKYIIASKLKQRMSTPMFSKLAQQQFGIDPKAYDLQRLQSEMAPKMGGWNGMRNWLFNVYKEDGGPIVDPRGQWAYPGQVTRIPGSDITMQGVPYPVYGVGSNGQEQMMYSGQEYNFGGAAYVDEYPMMQGGGSWNKFDIPKAQNGLTAKDKNNIIGYIQKLSKNKSSVENSQAVPVNNSRELSKEDMQRIASMSKLMVPTNTREVLDAERKEKYGSQWEAEKIEDKRKKEERKTAAITRSKVLAGDDAASFTFPDGTTKKWKDMDWREQSYISGKNLGSWNNDNWTDYINPLALLGSLSEGIGTAPYEAKKTDSIKPYLFGVGAPLLTGALGSLGAKNAGQFVENIVSPIPGNLSSIGRYLTEKTPLRSANKFNPFALTDNMLFNKEGVVNRQIFGDEAFENFKQYGPTTRPNISQSDQMMDLVRAPKSDVISGSGEAFQVAKTMEDGAFKYPYFQEGNLWYRGQQRSNLANQIGKERIITTPKSDVWFAPAGESSLMLGDDVSQGLIDSYSKGRRVLMPGASEYAKPSKYSVFEPHWWKGYKQIQEDGGQIYPMMQFGGGTLLGPSPLIMSLASKVANYFSKPNSSAGTPKTSSKSSLSSYEQMNSTFFNKNEDFYNKREANDTKKYDNSSNSINLSSGRFRGAKVAPAMIDDIVNAAKANNVDPWVMLSLVGRESTFGSGAPDNFGRSGNKEDLISGWNVAEDYQPYEVNRYLADKKVPGIKVIKDSQGWVYKVEDEKAVENYLKTNPKLIDDYYKKLESTPDLGKLDSFSLAAQRIKKKGIQNYNPGDPRYSSMVNQDMRLLKNDAALKAYMKTLGYKDGGRVKMQSGGQSTNKSPYFFMNLNNDFNTRINNIDYVKGEYNKGMDFHNKWLNSPMYNSMINASDPTNAKQITDQRKKRLSAVNMKYVDTPYSKAGASSDHLGNIEVYPEGIGAKGIGVHEMSHVTDTGPGQNLIPAKDRIDISRYSLASENMPNYEANKEYFNYVTKPSETRARLNEIRQGASENKLYDPFTQKVNPAIYNKLKNFKFNSTPGSDPLQQLKSAYSDQQILEMLNSVSKVNNNNNIQDMMYAKQGGEMIRRADGSYSRRGLWDNIRANKGSGKKPSKEMLEQERKIKAKSMANGGTNNAGFEALPEYVQAKILSNMGYGGYYNPMMATGGEKMPPEIARARFAAAGNLDQMSNYGYAYGGYIPEMMYGGYDYMAEGGEPNGGMALGQMMAVADKMNKLRQFITPEQNLDPWIASKLAVIDDSTAAISDYMMYNPEAQEMQGGMPEMGRGGYTVTRSSDRKGKTHKVTGPDGTVKYFGDSNLGQHPKDPKRKAAFYARHKKNLDNNPFFRAFARKTWADGGSTFSGNAFYQSGGPVDGDIMDVTPEEAEALRKQGYQFEII